MRISLATVLGAVLALGACTTVAGPAFTPVERTMDQISLSGADRAEVLLANGKFDAAAALYRAQLSAEPENHDLKYKLAEAYRVGSKFPEARDTFLELTAMESWKAKAFEGLGLVGLAAGDREGARLAFQNATQADASAWKSWLALAQLSDLDGAWQISDELYAVAMSTTPEPAAVYNNQGMSLMARGNAVEAAEMFRRALTAEPALAKARTNLDLAEAIGGAPRPSDASRDPREQAQRLNNFAFVAVQQNRTDDAMRLYQQAIATHPSFYALAFNTLADLKRAPLAASLAVSAANVAEH